MKIFKIQRNSDQLFSKGGYNPRFSEKGKIWSGLGPLSSHLNSLDRNKLVGWTVIEYDIDENYNTMICTKTPAVKVFDESMKRREKRLEGEKVRRLKSEIKQAELRLKGAEEERRKAEARLKQLAGGKNG